MAEDSERFKLPLKWKPGTDLMSKMLLSDPEIMRIVIQSLLGEDVPPDSYSVAPTEWADGSRSDMVAEFQDEFTASADGLLLETVSTLNPMAALGYFITLHTMTQVPRQHWRYPTLALAFRIVDNILAKKGEDVPPDSYSVAPTEGTDTKGVYTLYVSQNMSNEKLIPVLVVIQEEVNQSTILEIVERSALVCENFRILPTVLVISIKSSSKLKNDGEFDVIDHPFLMQCQSSKFWASKCCYLFFADNLVNMNTTNTFATALFTL
ncbi:hypothetical protein [Parasitella parasitica]|uniref:Uncharacterized protein n=1 Tax=Parasitella parasitica TaxID=35722 RepID=A0A0B7N975_9FUNG|nr:hypothetical protein [Parasitella parasitica]